MGCGTVWTCWIDHLCIHTMHLDWGPICMWDWLSCTKYYANELKIPVISPKQDLHYGIQTKVLYSIHHRSRNPFTTPCNDAISHGAPFGVFGFLLTTHAETNANKMSLQSVSAMQLFTHIYLHVQTAADAGDICTWRMTVFWSRGKPRTFPIGGTPWKEENGADSWISNLNRWYTHYTLLNIPAKL